MKKNIKLKKRRTTLKQLAREKGYVVANEKISFSSLNVEVWISTALSGDPILCVASTRSAAEAGLRAALMLTKKRAT